MLGLSRHEVKLVKYQPAWARAFAAERAALERTLGPAVRGIEHVGSTAIPGLSAKPVLDLLLAVDALEDYGSWVEPLGSLGYEFRRDNRAAQGHVLFVKGPETARTHYLKLTTRDSGCWRDLIGFRDHLRSHPDAVAAYQALKERLASAPDVDRPAYTAAKSDFIRGILREIGAG